jgi:ATP-dependent RNA helicase DDX31/DBP7
MLPRLKAKRVTKRKARSGEGPAPGTSKKGAEGVAPRPAKRSRVEHVEGVPKSRPPTQIISSLFSRNPEVEAPLQTASPKTPSKPSNAPLDLFSFAGLGLDPLITAHLNTKMNILKPTSIQRAVLSLLLSNQTEERANRDVFIQSQTGSGKTLAYLLPIIEDLLPLSSHSYIDRSIGTLAIVIAPTRELAKQISEVLEALLTLRLRADGEKAADPAPSTRRTRWLVSGLLVGGATRTHEKARLRKGVPILVSTPGRLLDHLQNTSSFNVGKCRWLVLDEADRLMELGFEETITGIVKGLDGRRRLAMHAVQEGTSTEVGGWDWSRRRRVILCSATMREDVQKLAGTVLVHPMMIKATESDALSGEPPQISFADGPSSSSTPFTPPSQLAQKYVIVPLKLRLVALIALLRSLLAQSRRDCKIIVFFSCTDSVDFHWHLLGGSHMGDEDESESATSDAGNGESGAADVASPKVVKTGVKSSLLPEASIFRLHGSLPTATRLASLKDFTAPPPGTGKTPTASASSILLCTSVASRGLDLPLVRAVVQYDLPTEGGSTEYVHRVGRTARAGKGGEAWSIVAPSEALWVKWVEGKMQGEKTTGAVATDEQRISLNGATIESVLAKGFGGKGTEYEARATEVQLAFERWVLHRKEVRNLLYPVTLS